MKKYLDILGHKVSDKVTGFNGVAVSVSFDLYGCIQVVVNPGLSSDGKPMDSHWFDFNRLQIVDLNPVMKRPDYEKTMTEEGMINAQHGCSDKPLSKW